MEATVEVGELSIQSPLDRSIQNSVAVSPSITCIQFQMPCPPPFTLQYALWCSPGHTPRSELQKQQSPRLFVCAYIFTEDLSRAAVQRGLLKLVGQLCPLLRLVWGTSEQTVLQVRTLSAPVQADTPGAAGAGGREEVALCTDAGETLRSRGTRREAGTHFVPHCACSIRLPVSPYNACIATCPFSR